ncbi:PepSY domain-containing protein [Cellulophaga baltica]|uniref:PepSY-associated TM helix domain-containing protein n=1 Tax=Cellulophaga TaxID=104264 RepID=UPI001C06CDF7|nr:MULTISPECIES: PepSY-associated TM helix domain-containing protein [Cellulophaga]MBU2996664.1 PepSY domain-containing protein [Cellulophaga baltica]MDO6768058.1 PepSY-associated TM helix domain-containing protein [Cellulophaga sp. 1_MG-2023]
MKKLKKIFFQLHSWIGINLSILFFVVCFSGTLATIAREIDWIFRPDIRVSVQELKADKNEIVKKIEKAYPDGVITEWEGGRMPYLCDLVSVEKEGLEWYVFVNPYTGEIQGATTLTFQRFIRDFHYYFFIDYNNVGHFMVLVFAFMLFIVTITALFFYKNWWKKLFELKINKGSAVLFRSLHRLVGVWSVPFCLLISITGIWYFIERTNTANVSDVANPETPKIETLDLDETSFSNLGFTVDYNKVVSTAENAIPNLKVKDIKLPKNLNSPIYVTGKSDVPLVRYRANRVWLHPLTYDVVGIQKATEVGAKTLINDSADMLHFGVWGGLITKIIWFFFGLCLSTLVLTGIVIRLKKKTKKEADLKVAKWNYFNISVVVLLFGAMYYTLVVKYALAPYQIVLITGAFVILILLAYYVFGYKLKK